MEETQTTPQVNNQEALQQQSLDNSEALKNYESLIKQQQEQIEQLLKQQELSKKINQQLTETISQKVDLLNQGENKDNRHWVDKVIEDNFSYEGNFYNPKSVSSNDGSKTLATWYLHYLKSEKGLSNSEAASRIGNIFKFCETGEQISEELIEKE